MITALLTNVAARAWARSAMGYGATALAIALFLLALRRSCERAGRLETLEKVNDAQRRMRRSPPW